MLVQFYTCASFRLGVALKFIRCSQVEMTQSNWQHFLILFFLCSISLCASAAEGVLCRWNYLKVSKGDVT